MNAHDDFEDRLRAQPFKSIPPSWRRDILELRRVAVPAQKSWLRQLLWPHPAAWGALAAVWLFVGLLNLTEPRREVPALTEKSAPDQRLVWAEHRRLWLELIDPEEAQAQTDIDDSAPLRTGPRSEGKSRRPSLG